MISAKKLRFRHRMLVRVYLFGVGLLVAFVIAIAVAVPVMKPSLDRHMFGAIEIFLADSIALRSDSAALQVRSNEIYDKMNASPTFYSRDGTMLASSGEQSPPLQADELDAIDRALPHVFRRPGSTAVGAVDRHGKVERYGIVSLPPPDISVSFPLGLVLLFSFLAALSIPFARSVVRPVEDLARITTRFGTGDLSARAKLTRPDEVGALAAAFNEMADRIDATRRSERELLANVSHELRTPLARIRVVLDLATTSDGPLIRRYLTDISEDLAEIDALVEAVLTAARLDNNTAAAPYFPRDPEVFDLTGLVRNVAERFRTIDNHRTLTVEDASETFVHGDRALLRRAIENVLSNARKYSPAEKPIELGVETRKESAVVRIRDHGIGMAEDDLARLFTPFFRSDRSRGRDTGGIGLGLVLAQRIIVAHGGSIQVESSLGEGTTVAILLPQALVTSDGPP